MTEGSQGTSVREDEPADEPILMVKVPSFGASWQAVKMMKTRGRMIRLKRGNGKRFLSISELYDCIKCIKPLFFI